jgi:hypothetical protein
VQLRTGGRGQQLGTAADVGAHHAQPAQRRLQDADGQPLADGGLREGQQDAVRTRSPVRLLTAALGTKGLTVSSSAAEQKPGADLQVAPALGQHRCRLAEAAQLHILREAQRRDQAATALHVPRVKGQRPIDQQLVVCGGGRRC